MPKRKIGEEYLLKKLLERKIRRRHDGSLSDEGGSQDVSYKEIDAQVEPVTPQLRSKPEPDPHPEVEPVTQPNPEFSAIQVLGEKSTRDSVIVGPKIHNELADRRENELNEDDKESAPELNQVSPAANLPHVVVPAVANVKAETLAACTEINKVREYLMEARQRIISCSIAGVASAAKIVITDVQPQDLKMKLLEMLNSNSKL